MKKFLVLVTCLALVSVASADNQKKHKNKHDEQGQGQGQVQGNNQGKKFQANKIQGNKFQKNKFQGNKIQGNKFQGNKFQGNKFQGNKIQKNKLQANKFQGKKFQAKQFKKFNLANKQPNKNIPNVKFKAGYQIQGANKWKGNKYIVFKNYKSQWHDKGWWHHHHNHIVFVLGGWYFWDGGYYYPAWGYAPDAYYAFDGPIYTGSVDRDPGDVVANVQSALQEQGYYQGDIDGILGPQTRAALAEYQQSIDIEPTGAIDEPTLESLGMV